MNSIFAYISTYSANLKQQKSAFATFSFSNTAGFQATIPIKVTSPSTASISSAIEVYYYRSADGGASFETEANVGLVFPTLHTSNVAKTADLVLPDPGIYLISVLPGGGGGGTWSVDFGQTIQLVTAYA